MVQQTIHCETTVIEKEIIVQNQIFCSQYSKGIPCFSCKIVYFSFVVDVLRS